MQVMSGRAGPQFASDNCAGVCPEAWCALAEANSGHAPSYGEDAWTARACELLRATFECDCDVYFVLNGTAANGLALATLGDSYHAVVCHETAHIEIHECGAPAFFAKGMSLLPIPGPLGRITATDLERAAETSVGVHAPKPCGVSLTQATELGTVYQVGELSSIGASARRLGLRVHMDGARFANAVASLGRSPAELAWKAGVDVLSLGATKNGGLLGEAIVFFDRALGSEFAYRRMQAGQAASKMRFVTAPWVGMLESGAWLRHASHANAMACLLHDEVALLPGVKILFPVETNAVFIDVPERALAGLRHLGWSIPSVFGTTTCRLMCAWDTTPEDVRRFVTALTTQLE